MTRDKRKTTEILVAQLDPSLDISIEKAYTSWWHNLRNQGGMRLTKIGYETFVDLLRLEYYDFNLELRELDNKLIIQMDRRLQLPYYICYKKKIACRVVFFGSKEAVMVNLYGGLKKFIDNYK
jgi:hypothetical protein